MLRKSLEICRELGCCGHSVLAGETEPIFLSRYSRYVTKWFTYPSPLLAPEAFRTWLQATVARHRVDVVIPTDDETVALLSRERPQGVGALLPPQEAFRTLRDKATAAGAMAEAGVRHPETIAVTDVRELPAAISRLGLPLVIKPRISAGSRGLRIVHRPEDVAAEIGRASCRERVCHNV